MDWPSGEHSYISNALCASFAFARFGFGFGFRVCVPILEVIIVIAFDTDLQVRIGCRGFTLFQVSGSLSVSVAFGVVTFIPDYTK